MEELLVIMCWCLGQVKISDIACLSMEVPNLRCIDIMSCEDYGSIITRQCTIMYLDVYRRNQR